MICSLRDDACSEWMWWRRGEPLSIDFFLMSEDFFEGGGEEPGRRKDVCSTLAFEEEREPEG